MALEHHLVTTDVAQPVPHDVQSHLRLVPETQTGEQLRVGQCLDYLDTINEDPSKRSADVIAVSELIVDAFQRVDSTRPSREYDGEELNIVGEPVLNLGGGTNAVRGLSPYARTVQLLARVGLQAPYADQTDQLLDALPDNVRVRKIKDPSSRNPVKERYVDQSGRVVQVVNHQPRPLTPASQEAFLRELADVRQQLTGSETFVVSDYGRGGCSPEIMAAINGICETIPGINTIVDPRPGERNDKYNLRGMITPNKDEAAKLAGMSIKGDSTDEVVTNALIAARKIHLQYPNLDVVLLTLDKDGALCVPRDGRDIFHVPGTLEDDSLINPSGAGDIVVASLALLRQPFGLRQSVETAMWLAGTSVTQEGTSTLDQDLIQQTRNRLRTNSVS